MKKTLFYFLTLVMSCMLVLNCEKPETPDPDIQPDPDKPKQELSADFTYVANALEVQFTNTSKGATSSLWDFGDGSNSSETSPKHVYTAAGSYTVKLTVSNDEGTTAKKEASLTIAGAVKAYFSFEAQTDREGKFGKVVKFNATASENAASIVWDFGDETTGNEFELSHEFPDYGTYKVKATVTGLAGDTDVFEVEVEVAAFNELLKGGSMEEEDAQYWTFAPKWITDMDYSTPIEGKYCWQPYFGYKQDKPAGGEGGCLRLSSENQNHDFANNALFYQEIDVVEGDVLEISAEMKWGENSNDNGLLWFRIVDQVSDLDIDTTPAIIEIFNYWNAGGASIPAFDGNFAGGDDAFNACGYSGDGTPKVTYTAKKTGKVIFAVDYRSVWGATFGPGIDVLFDSISVKIIL